MDNKGKKEEMITLKDGSKIRYYSYPDGQKLMDMDDVMNALKSNSKNKQELQEVLQEFAQSVIVKKPEPKNKIELSDFNKKLEKGLNWNPKK
ncbi:MAG: hypothetical protein V4548_02070 [Bacteroidota bacterium]